MKTQSILSIALAVLGTAAQDSSPFSIFNQTGRLPDGCIDGYFAGSDTVLYTVPYTYSKVLSIIGSYKNLTWSGNPDETVSLNGTDNKVGTARMYEASGAHVVETITVYDKPAVGPYEEIHTLAPLSIPTYNVSFYADYDGTTATPTCNGAATAFNFTINFCATSVSTATVILHMLHMTDAQTVGVFLGNQNFTSCPAINSTSANDTARASTLSNITTGMGSGSTPIAFAGGAGALSASWVLVSIVALAAGFI
ncbi:hypothetical protein HO173_006336 [Letharia columbiana]|uniref:Uncharacterized protein n=1 Tax=Letharia columbiana TaxID=112416 RepID=A0A8H6L4T8_9LECA|nr:uncharacterized protein HO173_006336 [Letharia columbiana]KAF6235653.1 hypothetical protein HO173_006336 [Letharia columbiana]